jgi:hypothetical protein
MANIPDTGPHCPVDIFFFFLHGFHTVVHYATYYFVTGFLGVYRNLIVGLDNSEY